MDWLIGHLVGDYLLQNDWMQKKKQSTFHCLVHVLIYSTSVWVFTGWPLWAMAIVFVTHFIQDRTTIINRYMKLIGQDKFAQPPFGPWSIVMVDNVWHLVVLYLISLILQVLFPN